MVAGSFDGGHVKPGRRASACCPASWRPSMLAPTVLSAVAAIAVCRSAWRKRQRHGRPGLDRQASANGTRRSPPRTQPARIWRISKRRTPAVPSRLRRRRQGRDALLRHLRPDQRDAPQIGAADDMCIAESNGDGTARDGVPQPDGAARLRQRAGRGQSVHPEAGDRVQDAPATGSSMRRPRRARC